MLYLIIPPILIVFSLIGIILFIAKKAPKAARLAEKEKLKFYDEESEKHGIQEPSFGKSEKNETESKHRTLLILEKIVQAFKSVFLKMGNKSARWSESIREKRKKGMEQKPTSEIQNVDGDSVLPEAGGEQGYWDEIKKGEETIEKKPEMTGEGRKVEVRPFVSQKAAMPRSLPERKNLLEKILIERIAANPKDVEAYERLGEYYAEVASWKDAKECFKQVLKLDPGNRNVRSKMRKLERILKV
jgi:tetratricopeptide (TPR) repeat protein